MKRMLTVLAAVMAAAAVQADTLDFNVLAGVTEKQGAVSGDSVNFTGDGRLWMIGSQNSLGGLTMTADATTGEVLFSSEDGSKVTNAIAGSVHVEAGKTLVFSNSTLTVDGGLGYNGTGAKVILDGCRTDTDEDYAVVINGRLGTGTTGSGSGGKMIINNSRVKCTDLVIYTWPRTLGEIYLSNSVVHASNRWDLPRGNLVCYNSTMTYGTAYQGAGFGASGVMTVTVDGPDSLLNSCGLFQLGHDQQSGSTSTLYLKGGTVKCDAEIYLGCGGVGHVAQSGGTFTGSNSYKWLYIGKSSDACYEISGGTLDLAAFAWNSGNGGIHLAMAEGATGELRVLGGEVKACRTVGGPGTSYVTMNGGKVYYTGTGSTVTTDLTAMRIGKNGGILTGKAYSCGKYELAAPFVDYPDDAPDKLETKAYDTTNALNLQAVGAGDIWLEATGNTCGGLIECATGNTICKVADALSSNAVYRIKSGAVLDLGGFTHTVRGLTGNGKVQNGTLIVTGYVMPGYGALGGTLTIDSTATVTSSGLAAYVKADGTACGSLSGTLNLAPGAKIAASDRDRIANGHVAHSFGNSCTINATTYKCGTRGYVATLSGQTIALDKAGLAIVVQ